MALRQWNTASNFGNKPAFDFKVFKGVKKNFRAIQGEIKRTRAKIAQGFFIEIGSSLVKIQEFVVFYSPTQ